jgi:hypothetical protein
MKICIALFPDVLLLDSVLFDDSGKVVYGYVVNGDWTFRSNGIRNFAYRSTGDLLNPVNSWPAEMQRIVFIPADKRGHGAEYDAPLNWAKDQPAFEGDLEEFLDIAAIDAVNHKPTLLSGFDDMDDDIAF